jgi:hypothetical protein
MRVWSAARCEARHAYARFGRVAVRAALIGLAAVLGAAAAIACGHDACSLASDHADDCRVETADAGTEDAQAAASDAGTLSCTGVTECQAKCQIRATCEALLGGAGLQDYIACRARCE